MPEQQPTTTVVAITGASTLVEGILSGLLEEEGYSTKQLGSFPTGAMDELLEGVDLLLLAPGLKDRVREGFLAALRSTAETSAIPVLTLSDALKMALLDELSAGTSWRTLFEELVGQIGTALASAGAFVVESCRGPEHTPPTDQAGAAPL